MRTVLLLLPLLLIGFVCAPASASEASSDRPSLEFAACKEPGRLGYFRLSFEFERGRGPARDVLVVLAPFSAERDREGEYDPARMLDAAGALIGGLRATDRVNILSYADLLHGETWFPNEYPFVEHADDLFVRPQLLLEDWSSPEEAQAALATLRESGVETVRNTSWFVELLRAAHEAFEPGDRLAGDGHVASDGRVREIIVVADSRAVDSGGLLSGLPVDLPEIRLEPLDPEWTPGLFYRLRRDGVHVNFIAVADDETPAFSTTRLRRMAESTRGFYLDWPDDEAARARCIRHITTGLYRGLEVDFDRSDANYITTNRWSPADNEEGFVVWGRYAKKGRYTFTLRDTIGGYEWPFKVVLPGEAAQPELAAEWARQRLAEGLWKLATYGPDNYLTYDLQQLAYRYGLALAEAPGPSPFVEEPEPLELEPPRGKGAELEAPTLEADAERPPHSSLAELAPYDMIYVRYGRLRDAVQVLDMGYFYGRDAIQALGLHPDITLIEEQTQTQLCVRVSRKLTKLYEMAIGDVAIVSTGAAIAEGQDICLLMRIKMPAAFRLRTNQFRQWTIEAHPGTTKRRFRHEGVVVTETLGHHNVVRSYLAMFKHTPRGASKPQTFAVVGNSWAAVRRVIDVHVGKVPSIVANDDFAQFREKLPLAGFVDKTTGEAIDEDVLVYFGAPAAMTLTDWRIEALKKEQARVATHLRLLQNALDSYARDHAALREDVEWPKTIITTLVEEEYLPGVPVHPGVGAYAFDPDLQVFYSTRYGRLGWLTPMADLIDQVGEPRYTTPEIGPTAAQLAWTDDVVLTRAITRPDPKDFKFAILRALAGREMSDFSTFADMMRRPGLAVAMKSRLFEYGKGGFGMSKTQIALNVLAGKVRGELKKALGWEGDEDPFAWAGDEICVVLDARLANWRTALVDPAVAFSVKVKAGKEAEAAGVLDALAAAEGAVRRDDVPGMNVVTTRGWSLAVPQDSPGSATIVRDARFLGQEPSVDDGGLRAYLPDECHALIRFDTTEGDQTFRTALGLYGPAAEAQAQRTMARFESLYGNRLDRFRLESVPMMEDVPRPAGSQYGIDPVEQRIASDIYGLPGDFLLSGRVPLDAGIREALNQGAVGYGAVVLHRDAIEFVGAMPNPGIKAWKEKARPSSLSVSRRIRHLRTTRSLRKLARAVRKYDGYLWRLGLRGFELDSERFEERLENDRLCGTAADRAWDAIHVRQRNQWDDWAADPAYVELNGTRVNDLDFTPGMLWWSELVRLVEGSQSWQRSQLALGAGPPVYEPGAIERILRHLGEVKEHVPPDGDVRADDLAKLLGWSAIVQGRRVADELHSMLDHLNTYDKWWSDETITFMRERITEYLRIIEQE